MKLDKYMSGQYKFTDKHVNKIKNLKKLKNYIIKYTIYKTQSGGNNKSTHNSKIEFFKNERSTLKPDIDKLEANFVDDKAANDIIKQINVVFNIGNPVIPAAIPPAISVRDRANPNKYISVQLILLELLGLFTST
jgi:hypothetical protein